MSEQMGPRAAVKSIRRDLPKWGTIIPEIPLLAHEFLRRLRDDELVIKTQSDEIRQLRREMGTNHRRLFFCIVGSVLILGATIVAALDGYAPQMAYGAPITSWILGALGVVLLLVVWPSGRDQ